MLKKVVEWGTDRDKLAARKLLGKVLQEQNLVCEPSLPTPPSLRRAWAEGRGD